MLQMGTHKHQTRLVKLPRDKHSDSLSLTPLLEPSGLFYNNVNLVFNSTKMAKGPLTCSTRWSERLERMANA